MRALLALLPTAAVLLAVLVFRLSGVQAALAAAATAVLIALVAPFKAFDMGLGTRALVDAALLTLTAAAMIVPGILFVEATRRQKATEALAGLVGALEMSPARKAIFVAVGLGVMIESMTGMGVSLLVTVPLLLAIAPRRQAIGLALVGMSLMPWGALGISGIVGAALAGVNLEPFALWVSRVSGAVALVLPLLALAFVPHRTTSDVATALVSGLVLLGTIVAASYAFGLELAGALGGLAVLAALAIVSPAKGLGSALAAPGLRPYGVLLAAVIGQKLLLAPLAKAGLAPALSSGRVTFSVLASPGLALLATVLFASARHVDGTVLRATLMRGWRPVAAIALFMISARLLVECGAIGALAGALSDFGPDLAAVMTVMLGAISGFVTGSGVSGNALFMPAAAEAGRTFGALPLFAALQSGAAGHAAMASLSVGAILLAALPNRTRDDDRRVLVTGLALAAVHTMVLLAMALIWLRLIT